MMDTQPLIPPTKSSIEEYLLKLWADVLEVPFSEIDIDDNFYLLGGDSISGTKIIVNINEQYFLDDEITIILTYPTIRAYCEHIVQSLKERNPDIQPAEFRIKKSEIRAPIKATHVQQRMWFLNQYGDDIGSNGSIARRILGNLNIPALEKAIQSIIERHQPLRTRLKTGNNGADVFLDIVDDYDFTLNVTEATEEQFKTIRRSKLIQPFDLTADFAWKCNLYMLSDNEYILFIVVHDSVFDHWSVNLFTTELSILYSAFVNQSPSPLEDLKVEYLDYVMWQQSHDYSKQLNYWKKKLQNLPSPMALPYDFTYPASYTHNGETVYRLFPKETLDELNLFCITESCTLFMILMTGLHVLLWQYSRQEDIVVGAIVTNRKSPELEDLIGLFLNNVIIRTTINPSSNFLGFLAAVKKTMLEAYENQNIDYGLVIQEIHPTRNPQFSSFTQVNYAMQNVKKGFFSLEGVEVINDIVEEGYGSQFEMLLRTTEQEDGLLVSMEYNTDLFKRETMESLLEHYQLLMDFVMAAPYQTLKSLPPPK